MSLDTRAVDDVILGCVEPVGEQGANIGRLAAIYAGYHEEVPRHAGEPFLRLGGWKHQHRHGPNQKGAAALIVRGGVTI